MGIIFRKPAPAIPDQHSAAAIFTFGDRAFELVILNGVIFDLYGEALLARHKARPSGYGPAFHDTVEL